MSLRRVIEERKEPELAASLIEYVCYRNRKISLHELKSFLGLEQFLKFINLFSGTYIHVPSSKKLKDLYYDYIAAITVVRIKAARKKRDLTEWTNQEVILSKIAKKTKRKQKNVYMRGLKIIRDLKKAKAWSRSMEVWENKHLKGEK